MRTFAVASIFVLPAFFACHAEDSTCMNEPALGSCTADGTDGGAPSGDAGLDVVAPPGCDLTKSPKDSPACVDETVGVFVSPTGNDSSAGSKARPLKTIAKAIAMAAAKGLPRVYVCEGPYGDAVILKSAVSIYGGFACDRMFPYSGAKPRVQPTDGTQYALDIAASNVTIADMEFIGPDRGAPNSIAVRVVNAVGVVFERVRLESRAGAYGAAGSRDDFTVLPTLADLSGNDATAGGPGGAKEYTCPGGAKTTGGKGGASGFDGDPGLPVLGGGAGGTVSQCETTYQGGLPGASGVSAPPADGASAAGSVVSNAWVPQAGGDGANGGPGQGGGGGAGLAGGNGGGGGAGGCGGVGGGGGAGGGASIALLAITSDVALRSAVLVTGRAGDGGMGLGGFAGQMIFGLGGAKTGAGCDGANGGPGGNGGAGGGGAGGLSAAVVHKGTKPGATDVTIKTGTAGAKGTGGAHGINDGIEGTATDYFEVE